MVAALVGTRDTRRDFVSFAHRSDGRRGGTLVLPPTPIIVDGTGRDGGRMLVPIAEGIRADVLCAASSPRFFAKVGHIPPTLCKFTPLNQNIFFPMSLCPTLNYALGSQIK